MDLYLVKHSIKVKIQICYFDLFFFNLFGKGGIPCFNRYQRPLLQSAVSELGDLQQGGGGAVQVFLFPGLHGRTLRSRARYQYLMKDGAHTVLCVGLKKLSLFVHYINVLIFFYMCCFKTPVCQTRVRMAVIVLKSPIYLHLVAHVLRNSKDLFVKQVKTKATTIGTTVSYFVLS